VNDADAFMAKWGEKKQKKMIWGLDIFSFLGYIGIVR